MDLLERILSKMSVSQPQKHFLFILFSTIMALRGRMNYRNLSRYSEYHEKTFSRNFRKPFDFEDLNHQLIAEVVPANSSKMAALDASYDPKSGKQSYGIDYFWSGVANRSKKGQELSSLVIVDRDYKAAYNLSVVQTPSSEEIGDEEDNRIDFYLKQVTDNQAHLRQLRITYLGVDGFYTKNRFFNGVEELGFYQIGRLRSDANLRYLYQGPQKPRGRRKTYDGKVFFDDFSRWDFVEEIEPGILLYSDTLNANHFKRNLRVVCLLNLRNLKKNKHVLLFSTDLEQAPLEILNCYKARFQIEFLFRGGGPRMENSSQG